MSPRQIFRRAPELLVLGIVLAIINGLAKEASASSLAILIANIGGTVVACGIRYIFEVLD